MSFIRYFRLVTASALVCALATGCCAHAPPTVVAPGPSDVAKRYAKALREGRLDDAWALTSKPFRTQVDSASFKRRYQNADVRRARADAISAANLRVTSAFLSLQQEGAHWRVSADSDGDAAAVARAFLDAAEAGDFKTAYGLLAGALKARYSPERFAEDFRSEPQSKERLSRAREALRNPPEQTGAEVRFGIGEGLALRLLREADGFRVLAIE